MRTENECLAALQSLDVSVLKKAYFKVKLGLNANGGIPEYAEILVDLDKRTAMAFGDGNLSASHVCDADGKVSIWNLLWASDVIGVLTADDGAVCLKNRFGSHDSAAVEDKLIGSKLRLENMVKTGNSPKTLEICK